MRASKYVTVIMNTSPGKSVLPVTAHDAKPYSSRTRSDVILTPPGAKQPAHEQQLSDVIRVMVCDQQSFTQYVLTCAVRDF